MPFYIRSLKRMDASESEFGLTLTLHSKASKDVYPDNSPSSFTNILKIPVTLDQNERYECCLANIHSPVHQSLILKKREHMRNDIKFHLGMFIYNEDKARWDMLDKSKIDLWSYNLNKNISGIDYDDDTDITRIDFFKRFRDSFNLSDRVELSQIQSLSLFNLFLRHKYDAGHKVQLTVSECPKCQELVAIAEGGEAVREKVKVGDGLPPIDFFEDYDTSKRNHIWLKNIDDLPSGEKYYIFDNMFSLLGVDKYDYLRDVTHKYMSNTRKRSIHKIIHAIKDENNKKYTQFEKIFNHDVYTSLWHGYKSMPQLVLYTSFGEKMDNFFSVDQKSKIAMVTCGNEHQLNMFNDNPILTPQFVNPKIGSLFIYSDIVSKSVRVANQITNLLGIVSIDQAIYNKPSPPTIYRPISHNYIQSVSVKITDENGEKVNFKKDAYVGLEILIRKRS